MKRNLIFCLFLILLGLPFTAKAQVANDKILYAPTKPAYLARSYWFLNNLDTKSNDNVDQYLMMTECDLYKQYFSNDIEWSKIREATRKYIEVNKATFPSRFEYVQPLYLDRYDPPSKTFFIVPKYQMTGVTQMQISGNVPAEYPCVYDNTRYRPDVFPLNAIITFSRPLNYTHVKAEPEIVEEYLKYLADNNIKSQEGRPVYVRYRVKVEQSLKPVKNRDYFANFFGSLEAMTIFGDRDMLIKLEEVKF